MLHFAATYNHNHCGCMVTDTSVTLYIVGLSVTCIQLCGDQLIKLQEEGKKTEEISSKLSLYAW